MIGKQNSVYADARGTNLPKQATSLCQAENIWSGDSYLLIFNSLNNIEQYCKIR